jgi:TRAP-type C4-dicarboxylate transport system permease small subunit
MKKFQSLIGIVAAATLFAMMLLTFADVVGRKLLGGSIPGAVELTELCMLVMIFTALPLASIVGEHIVFDLLDRVMPARLFQWQQMLANLLTGLVFAGAAWLVWLRSGRTYEMGDITSRLEIPLGPFHQMVAVMLLLTAVAHAVLAGQALWRAGRGSQAPSSRGHAPADATRSQ